MISSSYDIGIFRRPRILIVDDEVHVRHLIEKVIHDAGYVAIPAKSGAEAIEISDSDPELDLLITDLVMRPMDGIELAKTLLERRPGLPVLFTSGYSEHQRGDRKLPPGAEFVEKPFTPAQILELTQKLLGPDKPPHPWS